MKLSSIYKRNTKHHLGRAQNFLGWRTMRTGVSKSNEDQDRLNRCSFCTVSLASPVRWVRRARRELNGSRPLRFSKVDFHPKNSRKMLYSNLAFQMDHLYLNSMRVEGFFFVKPGQFRKSLMAHGRARRPSCRHLWLLPGSSGFPAKSTGSCSDRWNACTSPFFIKSLEYEK